MRIFLDSVSLQEVELYQNYIDGVTTNPSLVKKALDENSDSTNGSQLLTDILKTFNLEVSVQVLASNYESMISNGEAVLRNSRNFVATPVIKIPLTWDGLKACKYFSHHGVKVNMTLCFSAQQALMAAKAGAAYVSPFVGRMQDEIGDDAGFKLISDIRAIYDRYDWTRGSFVTSILASSIRNIDQVREVAVRGADVVTLPSAIMAKMMDHDLSKAGLARFASDSESLQMDENCVLWKK